ncbi:hypothetical protein [Streptomyces bohaiensis]|uniref:hypothetical protein n=1 Tax=Streptomyces bohaiensis TaxID=1431344 RepID=UPI003B76162F
MQHTRARTLATAAGWAHPYPMTPWSPVLYADGGGEGGSDGGADDAAGGNADDDGQGEDDDSDNDDSGTEQLGDAGKRALDSMKDKWKAERDQRKALERQIKDRDATDEAAKEKLAAEDAALAKANGRILRAEIRAAAKGRLADAGDALRYLDLSEFEVGEDGEVDIDEIEAAVDKLVKDKPYLAGKQKPSFEGRGDGGAAGRGSGPKQLTREDLKTMSPAQIVKAKADGQLADLLGSK